MSGLQRLSGNQLKIIAAICMTADHIGLMLFPQCLLLRIIGRVAMPLFAYMIAEGCRYTKNRTRYLLGIVTLAAVVQLLYYFALNSLYQCILVTFALSIGLIYMADYAIKKRSAFSWLPFAFLLAATAFLTMVLPRLLSGTDFAIDYGFWGVLLPVGVYLGKTKKQQLALCGVGLALLTVTYGTIQAFSFLALPLLMLYSGARGRLKMKYFFYIYFPVHLVALWLLGFWI